ERVDRGTDARGKEGAAQVQAAEQCVQPGDAGQPLCVADDVDGAGVPAAGDDDQSLAAHVHDEGLVVEDQRVGFPRGAGPVLVCGGHAVFEVGGAVNLTGDQEGAVGEQGRLAALDHLEAVAGQRMFAECRPVVGPTAGQGEAAAGPHQRVDNHWQGPGSAPPGECGQAAGVVEVAVAEHYGVHGGQVEAEPAGVGDQGVIDVVDQRGDDDAVHRLQCDRVGRAAHDRVRHRGADVGGGGRFLAHGCYCPVATSTISMSPVATS